MIPSAYYLQQIKAEHKQLDDAQLEIIRHFDRLYRELNAPKHFTQRIKEHFKAKSARGIYLWGEVGRGKTFLVDCFVHCLNNIPHTRIHFHEFMRRVHAELKLIQGKTNPLALIVKKFRQEFKVLCLDEFVVSDITDAMILGELLRALFAEGISLVTTSNTVPDELYRSGLQRERFLPAIHLLNTETEVIHLQSAEDYRLRHLTQAGVYYTPLNAQTEQLIQHSFNVLTHHQHWTDTQIELLGRSIAIKARNHHIIWFDFMALCGNQRSQNDYLAISEQFTVVFISNIPIIKSQQRDLITNFIKLIDVLYDTKTKVVISAAAPPLGLYTEGPEAKLYERTASRLIEMQSKEYFSG